MWQDKMELTVEDPEKDFFVIKIMGELTQPIDNPVSEEMLGVQIVLVKYLRDENLTGMQFKLSMKLLSYNLGQIDLRKSRELVDCHDMQQQIIDSEQLNSYGKNRNIMWK